MIFLRLQCEGIDSMVMINIIFWSHQGNILQILDIAVIILRDKGWFTYYVRMNPGSNVLRKAYTPNLFQIFHHFPIRRNLLLLKFIYLLLYRQSMSLYQIRKNRQTTNLIHEHIDIEVSVKNITFLLHS